MVTHFVNYYTTVDKLKNDKDFMDKHGDLIFLLHKQQIEEEKQLGYSYKQYDVLRYYMALDYCINLWFVILETLSNESITDAKLKAKERFNFKDIQTNLAHKNIDLDEIFNMIEINYTSVKYEQV
jgi:hypothetical protein